MSRHRTLPDTHDPDNRHCRRRCHHRRTPRSLLSSSVLPLFCPSPPPTPQPPPCRCRPTPHCSAAIRVKASRSDGFPALYARAYVHLHCRSLVRGRDRIIIYYAWTVLGGPLVPSGAITCDFA